MSIKTTKDAVKHFNSVWPYSDDYSYIMQSPQGYYSQSHLVGIGEFSILVCNREQFESCVRGEL